MAQIMANIQKNSYNSKIKYIYLVLILTIIVTINAPDTSGAIIHGTVYDYNLNKIDNVQVVLGSEKTITEDGTYRFSVNPGEYTLEARRIDRFGNLISSTSDNINIKEDKEYVLDLILFETMDFPGNDSGGELDPIGSEIGNELIETRYSGKFWIVFTIMAVIILCATTTLFVRHFKKELSKVEKTTHEKIRKTEEKIKTAEKKLEKTDNQDDLPNDAKKVMDFIKSREGRCTQLEIREKFPSSEAKISLIISELEHKGKIQKIKKGRGNIIILK